MRYKNYLSEIVKEVVSVVEKVDDNELKNFEKLVIESKHIFIYGEGRSGNIGKCFAMRLMHIGLSSYVVWETTTPGFNEGDLLVCISGSGETESVILNAKKAKKKGTKVIAVTTNKNSTLGELCHSSLLVKATTRSKVGDRKSIQLLGSLFDQSVHLIFDNLCLLTSENLGISNEEATKNHI